MEETGSQLEMEDGRNRKSAGDGWWRKQEVNWEMDDGRNKKSAGRWLVEEAGSQQGDG